MAAGHELVVRRAAIFSACLLSFLLFLPIAQYKLLRYSNCWLHNIIRPVLILLKDVLNMFSFTNVSNMFFIKKFGLAIVRGGAAVSHPIIRAIQYLALRQRAGLSMCPVSGRHRWISPCALTCAALCESISNRGATMRG